MENLFEINLSKPEIDAISNLGLAHMGDCVFEILCRAYLCARGEKTVDRLHRDTIAMVKAPAQAQFADRMLPLLTEEERAWIKWKEQAVKDAGSEMEGGSMQPLLENDKAAEVTRERVYELAGWLK